MIGVIFDMRRFYEVRQEKTSTLFVTFSYLLSYVTCHFQIEYSFVSKQLMYMFVHIQENTDNTTIKQKHPKFD